MLAAPVPACGFNPGAARAMNRLRDAMAHGRFVAYQPTSLRMVDGTPTNAEAASIRADLRVLRPRFDALVTYDAVHGAEQIPDLAAALGFHAIIIGVWNPFDPAQLDAALASARRHPDIVAGLSLGNEMIFAGKHTFAEVATLAVDVRQRLRSIPVSTTEPFHIYYDPAAAVLLRQLDFLLANVHPVFQPWFRNAPDGNAAEFVLNVVTKLGGEFCGPILVKEVGVPTAPADMGFTPERQDTFYAALRSRFPASPDRAFTYFAAFDMPWRAYDELAAPGGNASAGAHVSEAHWGLYDESRRPKPAVDHIPLLSAADR